MKNLKTFSLLFIGVLISASTFTACKKGDDGKTGATGASGASGAAGAAGATGAIGATGAAGLSGNTLLNGNGDPADTLGVEGDFYYSLDEKMLYGPKTSEGWGAGFSVQGPTGEAGKNADVSVDTFTIYNESWVYREDYEFKIQTTATNTVTWPGMAYVRYNTYITGDILANGLVIVDLKMSPVIDPYRWTPLPFSTNAGTFDMNLDYRMGVGGIEIDYYLSTNANAVAPTSADVEAVVLPSYQVKVIAIPGTVVTVIDRMMKEQKANVKTN